MDPTRRGDKRLTSDNKSPANQYDANTLPSYSDIAATDRPSNEDAQLLARLGYKQELRREFNKWSTVSYAISVLGVLGSQPATYGVPLGVGGPATAVWAWLVGSCMSGVIATSVAELVSAYPTAGGIYFVTKHVVPPEHVAIWAWVIGWANFLGQSAGVASLAYTVAQMVLAAASMNSGAVEDGYQYTPTPIQTVLLSLAVLCIFGTICTLSTKKLHQIILWFAPINVLATIGICIALLVCTPDKRSASFVFTHFTDDSGWSSKGWSFLLGFLNVAWVMTDYDATTHLSEETHDAAIRGPWAIVNAIFVTGVLGFFLNVTFGFCLTENYMDDIVNSPTGFPVAQIFLNAGGRSGGTAMLFMVILVQFFTGASALLANARMAYAFSRDEALPCSSFFNRINRITGTPVNAVWLVVTFCACLNLIGLGSTQTITAIFNLCAPCLDLSYIAVIAAHLWYSKRIDFVPGPFDLDTMLKPLKISKPINLVAIAWVVFISVVLFCPTSKPVTAENMNYAIVVAGFVALFSMAWWYAGARKNYVGPRTQDIMAGVSGEGQAARREDEESRDYSTFT